MEVRQGGCPALECPRQWALPSSPPLYSSLAFAAFNRQMLPMLMENGDQWVKGNLSTIYMTWHCFPNPSKDSPACHIHTLPAEWQSKDHSYS